MILDRLDMDAYLSLPSLGSSDLKIILNSPADFIANCSRIKNETKATTLGTAIHAAILEPDEFNDRYVIQNQDWGPRNKGEGYQRWKEFKAEAKESGKLVIAFEDSLLLKRVIDATEKHKGLRSLLKGAAFEKTAISTDGKLKARADLITVDNYIWDLKTTSKGVNDNDISKTIYTMGYHFQAAHHMRVFVDHMPIEGFGWIFVSTDTPAVHIVTRKASQTLLKAGKKDHDYALTLLHECNTTGNWWGYDDGISEIDLPLWIESIAL